MEINNVVKFKIGGTRFSASFSMTYSIMEMEMVTVCVLKVNNPRLHIHAGVALRKDSALDERDDGKARKLAFNRAASAYVNSVLSNPELFTCALAKEKMESSYLFEELKRYMMHEMRKAFRDAVQDDRL